MHNYLGQVKLEFPWSLQGNARFARSRVACGWGIKFLGFDASQVDGTRAIQQKKTPYTHLQCRRLGPQWTLIEEGCFSHTFNDHWNILQLPVDTLYAPF